MVGQLCLCGVSSSTVFAEPDTLTLRRRTFLKLQSANEELPNRKGDNQINEVVVLSADSDHTVAIPLLNCGDSPNRPTFNIVVWLLGMDTVVVHGYYQVASTVYVSCLLVASRIAVR